MALLCSLYNIRYDQIHPLRGAEPVPYVPVRVKLCAFATHRYTYAPGRSGTSHTAGFLFLSRCLCGTIRWCILAGFNKANAFLLAYAARSRIVICSFPFLFFLSIRWYPGAGVFGLIV